MVFGAEFGIRPNQVPFLVSLLLFSSFWAVFRPVEVVMLFVL